MPRGTKIAPALRREWFDAYERGARIDQLAKLAGRTERTVRDHIERASQEREAREARGGLLRNAVQGHLADLLGVAQRLRQRAPQSEGPALQPPHDVSTRLLLEGLRRHLPRSPLWKAHEQWVQATHDLAGLQRRFEARWQQRVASELAPLLPEDDGRGWVSGLWFAARRASANQGVDDMVYRRERSDVGTTLAWGSFDVARTVLSDPLVDRLEGLHGNLVKEAMQDIDLGAIVKAQAQLRAAPAAIDEEVEKLLLRRLLPGRCSLCPA